MNIINTERLTIRPFAMADLDQIHQILDVDLQFDDLTLKQRKRWLRWAVLNVTELVRLCQPPYGDRAITLRHTETIIGTVGLVPAMGPFDQLPYFKSNPTPYAMNRPEVGLFWALDPVYQCQGYATEAAGALIEFAFSDLHLKRIIATTDYANTRSQALMRRLHMVIQENPFPDPEWFQVVGILENV